MDSKNTSAPVILFLCINILFCSQLVGACETNHSTNAPTPTHRAPTSSPKPPSPISVPSHAPSLAPTYDNNARKCPQDALRLGVCVNVLNLVNVVVGSPPTLPCCTLIQGLVDLEAALCLCTAIRANVLGINLNVPVALSLVLNNCGKNVPTGFECY